MFYQASGKAKTLENLLPKSCFTFYLRNDNENFKLS